MMTVGSISSSIYVCKQWAGSGERSVLTLCLFCLDYYECDKMRR